MDFPGYDQDQISASSFQECFNVCSIRGNACQAVVWVPSYGSTAGAYTCFLKNSGPSSSASYVQQTYSYDVLVRTTNDIYYSEPVVPSCSNGSPNIVTYETADGAVWQLSCGMTISPGPNGSGQLISYQATSLQVCIDMCAVYDNIGSSACSVAIWLTAGQNSGTPVCKLILGAYTRTTGSYAGAVKMQARQYSALPSATCSTF